MMQKKWNYLCLLALLMSVWACSGNSNETETENTNVEDTTSAPTKVEPEQAAAPDATTLEGFWKGFREAIAAKDVEKLKSMSDLTKLEEDFYNDIFFQIFQAKITAATADQVKLAEGQEEGTYEFSYFEIPENQSSDEEGEGSGASIFFKKGADGNFKVVGMMAYG